MNLEDNLRDLKEVAAFANDPSIVSDFITSLCGEKIDFGCFRDVFNYNLNDNYVIKIEPGVSGCNFIEWMTWNEVKHLTGKLAWVKNWFAPVDWISPNNKILVMKKTHIARNRKRPDKVPKFLWDVKPDNFGWLGKNYVCHDYGQFYNFINYSKSMKKIDWEKYD